MNKGYLKLANYNPNPIHVRNPTIQVCHRNKEIESLHKCTHIRNARKQKIVKASEAIALKTAKQRQANGGATMTSVRTDAASARYLCKTNPVSSTTFANRCEANARKTADPIQQMALSAKINTVHVTRIARAGSRVDILQILSFHPFPNAGRLLGQDQESISYKHCRFILFQMLAD